MATTTTKIDFKTLVDEAEDKDDEVELHEAYRFSATTFYEDDDDGVYGDA